MKGRKVERSNRFKTLKKKTLQLGNSQRESEANKSEKKTKESCVFQLRYEVLIIANNCKQKNQSKRGKQIETK